MNTNLFKSLPFLLNYLEIDEQEKTDFFHLYSPPGTAVNDTAALIEWAFRDSTDPNARLHVYFHCCVVRHELEALNKRFLHDLGTVDVFEEHAVLAEDKDSGDSQPITIFFKRGTEDVEIKAVKQARTSPDNVLSLSGNHIEYDYIGLTGCTKEGEWTVAKAGWVTTKELTPRTMDVENLFKHG